VVLGCVVFQTASKLPDICSVERSWGNVRHLKADKLSRLGGDSTEKQVILYSMIHIQEAHIKRTAMEKIDSMGRDAV
jgi:hypothetical protein